jgi:ribosomal protein L37E
MTVFVIECRLVTFHMESGKEQRVCVKFCFRVGKTTAETHNMLCEACGNDALCQMMAYAWFKCFKNGRTSTDDDEQSGGPSSSRSEPLIAQVEDIIHGYHWLTVQEVAEEVGISIGSCHTILTYDLGMHQVSAEFVPRLLTIRNCNDFPSVKISSKCHYRWQDVGLWLCCWNQTTILTLEESCFAPPQESMTSTLMSESNAACFFRPSRHYALSVCSWRSDI